MRPVVVEYFANQLNTDPDLFAKAIGALEHITGKKHVLEHLYEENQEKVTSILDYLKLKNPSAETLSEAITGNIIKLDAEIFEVLDKPVCTSNEGCSNLISAVLALHPQRTGFFIKRKVAEELLRKNPPKTILSDLGYQTIDEMLEKEDLFEVYAALRFVENREWLNSTYIPEYKKLKKEDFEKRPIEIRVLEASKWQRVAEAFIEKKLHPMSHLKELGIIFVVPSEELEKALTVYLFGMSGHYLDEVHLYSSYFEYYADSPSFGEKIVSAIRGDVPNISLRANDPNKWLVVQRYHFKEDPADPRIGTPHINPEALYHRGADRTLFKMQKIVGLLDFLIWRQTEYVAAWFPTKNGKETLVNFNLMDNVMDVMNKLSFEKRYSYHFIEALWNQIFIAYFGVEKMEDVVIKHLLNGWFDLRKI
jgi:hypothetical protein